jgi:hypothetical protein
VSPYLVIPISRKEIKKIFQNVFHLNMQLSTMNLWILGIIIWIICSLISYFIGKQGFFWSILMGLLITPWIVGGCYLAYSIIETHPEKAAQSALETDMKNVGLDLLPLVQEKNIPSIKNMNDVSCKQNNALFTYIDGSIDYMESVNKTISPSNKNDGFTAFILTDYEKGPLVGDYSCGPLKSTTHVYLGKGNVIIIQWPEKQIIGKYSMVSSTPPDSFTVPSCPPSYVMNIFADMPYLVEQCG